jgi:hypothetical protein
LPVGHKLGTVMGGVDRLGHLSLLGPQVRELLRPCCGTRLLAPEHLPGRPAWGQGLVRRLGDNTARGSRGRCCPGARPWA